MTTPVLGFLPAGRAGTGGRIVKSCPRCDAISRRAVLVLAALMFLTAIIATVSPAIRNAPPLPGAGSGGTPRT